MTVRLKSEILTIEAENISEENIYVQEVTFNGKRLEEPFIEHEELVEGGKLRFVMGPEPV